MLRDSEAPPLARLRSDWVGKGRASHRLKVLFAHRLQSQVMTQGDVGKVSLGRVAIHHDGADALRGLSQIMP